MKDVKPDNEFRGGYYARTICEVLREINDLVQGNNERDAAIRALLSDTQVMAKKMAHRLGQYHKKWNEGFWEKNPDWVADMERRLKKDYLAHEGKDSDS